MWLWAGQYIPFERLSSDPRVPRRNLSGEYGRWRPGAGRSCTPATPDPKPANADVENLLLYNIDATASGCFQPTVRNGVRFEMATGPRRDPPSGADLACSYLYRLISPGSDLSYWRPARTLASFTGANLGQFPSTRRLEQVWLAIHRADATAPGPRLPDAAPFAVFLTLQYPGTKTAAADPELVKALIDGATAAFHAHGDRAGLPEIALRVAANVGEQPKAITQMLADDRNAVLGVPRRLLYLRGTGVQWMPGDHMCMAGQVLCEAATADTWTLSGEILALEPRPQAARSRRSTSCRSLVVILLVSAISSCLLAVGSAWQLW